MKRRLFIFLLIFLSGTPLFSQTRGKLESISLFEKDLLILGEGRKGPYFLPDSLIIENSEKVFLNGKPEPRIAYIFNYIDGEIRFKNAVAKGTKIRILYKRSPYSLKKSYYHRKVHRRVFGAPTGPGEAIAQRKKSPQEEYGAQLSKTGSLTRGITVGTNRGLKVNSSLNLNVSGKVGDNVEVTAALTDQTTPIQPEGTTQNLQEIDKVFVRIKAPHLSATMGDYQLHLPESQFARYSRKLQGAMGKAEFDNLEVTVSGAVSRGKYFSLHFMGQEGNQGPYQLKGDRGQIDIIILAGTERVYIDGEQMVRGETNDYIIDYAAAQITFTRHRLITSDSRIVVDFQYSDEKFRRNLYSAQAKGKLLDGKVQLGATLLRESDDKNNPLDFTLSEDRLKVLRSAGDNPRKSVIDGATFVGPGKGRYRRDPAGIFVYVGPDSGDYQVSFSDVGENQGAYHYKGAGIYEYAGEKLGRYAPVILLPTARSHSIMDFSLNITPVRAVSLRGEMAVSSLDQNTYSTIDDGDNQGIAQNWLLAIKPEKLRFLGADLGKLSLTGKIRSVQDRFRDIDRTNIVEYNRRWDLPANSKRGEQVRDFAGSYEPFRDFSLGGEFGSIKKGDYFKSNRWQFRNQLSRAGLPAYNYTIERIRKDSRLDGRSGDWLRQRGNASYRLWKLKPIFDYEGEIKKENWADSLHTGFRFDDYTAGVEANAGSRLTAFAKFSQRRDDDYLGSDRFQNKSIAVTQNYALRLQQVKSFSASMELTHRERTFRDAKIGNKRTDLAEVRMQWTPWKRAVNANMNYQISNTATAKKERVYIKVSEGDGNYRYDEDLKEYVNDPLGDYILRILTTDDFLPVVELKTSSRLRIDPGRVWKSGRGRRSKMPGWKKALSALSSESYIAMDERTQEKDVWQIYLLNQSKFRRQGTTIFGNLQLRQDLFLFEHSRDFSLRLRYKSRDEINNQFLEGGQSRLEREKSARLTTRFSNKWSSRSEIIRKQTARSFQIASRQNRDIYSTEMRADISFRPTSPLEIALESRLSWEEDKFYEIPTQVKAYAFVPRVNYALRSKGRLRGELEWSYVDANPKGRLIPYEMANGRSLGRSLRWDIRFDYRISQTIQATFSYSGRNEPERNRTIHTGRAQVTAAFR